MIHLVDQVAEFDKIMNGEFIEYVRELKQDGTLRNIGLNTYSPDVTKMAALSGEIEIILFCLNPAFDMLPASEVVNQLIRNEDINQLFSEHYNGNLEGITPERE